MPSPETAAVAVSIVVPVRNGAALVRADPEVTRHLEAAALDSVFDLESYTRHVDVVFERLHALARKEEPVHA